MINEDKDSNSELAAKIKKYSIGIGACAVAFAVLSLVAANVIDDAETTQVTTTQAAEVEAQITNVPDTRQYETIIVPATEITTTPIPEQTSETQTQSAAPSSYSLPLGTDIGKDYSRGVPVYSSVMGDWRTHDGVDFNGAYGDGVKAIAGGIIKEIKEDPLMGGTIVIDHGGGVVATYSGVQVDEQLKRGIIVSESEKIGEISAIPSETDSQFPHIHLEIRIDGELHDPLEVMGYYE